MTLDELIAECVRGRKERLNRLDADIALFQSKLDPVQAERDKLAAEIREIEGMKGSNAHMGELR